MSYSIDDVKAQVRICAGKAIESEPMLTLLDSYSGDGDMGFSVQKGSYALLSMIESDCSDDIGSFFNNCGIVFNKTAASTIGTLISSCFFMLGIKLCGMTELSDHDILMIPEYMSVALMMRGNASVGDKTILDALVPFSNEFVKTYSRCRDLHTALCEGAKAAKLAAKATKGMIATIGRAKWIGERSREYPDAGAVLCALIVGAMAESEAEDCYKLPVYEA